ncbi:MAG: PASTA domain-containing protein [Gemmatimonadota bacterium]
MSGYDDRNAYTDRSRDPERDTVPVRSKRASEARVWLLRFAIVLGVGLVVGAGGGVIGVNTLEPGRPSEPDSLQVLLDSIARGTTPASGASADSDGDGDVPDTALDSMNRAVDTIVAAPDTVSVPDLIGVEEGAARTIILGNGLTVGPVEFRASATPAGTVIATIPVFGTAVDRGTAVSLVLSDGRPPVDTLPVTLRFQDSISRR